MAAPRITSGTESEFPSFIYGRSDNFKEQLLVTRGVDVPTALPLAEDVRDIAVENIELVGTTVEGVVRVRNRKMDCGELYARQVADNIGGYRTVQGVF